MKTITMVAVLALLALTGCGTSFTSLAGKSPKETASVLTTAIGAPAYLASCEAKFGSFANPPPSCEYTYSDWSVCKKEKQTRKVVTTLPADCVGTPVLSQECVVDKGYVITSGKREDITLETPCRIEFDATGMTPTDEMVEAHMIWAVVEGTDWNGGNVAPYKEVYAASFKDYKLKVNGFGEKRFDIPYDSAKTYHFALDIQKELTTAFVSLNGVALAEVSVDHISVDKVVVSYGWPPSKRKGKEGVVLTNIKAK